MTEIFTAKTIDEAKKLAELKFGKPMSEIRFEIIDEGKRGFLGIGKSDAKVKASYEEKVSASAESKEEPKQSAEVKPELADVIVNAPEQTAEKSASAQKESATSEISSETVKCNTSEEEDSDEYSLDKFTLTENESLIAPKVKIARDYITSILRAMGISAEYKIYQNESGAIINIESDNNGTIIGRRGETIDSIQYLCSIIANKGDKDYLRITVDCYGYRKKRRETLEHLAAKVAKSALRTGRPQPLEPMNPYERRVIHSAISKIDDVSSRSVGEEPYRKIIISPDNPRKNSHNYSKHKSNDNHRPNHRRNGKKEPFEPRAIDLSTSFEKDYKKPKPEDSLDTGLYGKIEF